MSRWSAGLRRASVGVARGAVPGALLAAAVLAVYLPATGFDYVSYDDPMDVVANPLLSEGLTAGSVARAFREPYGGFWIPVTWLSYMVDVDLFGKSPAAFHLTNVLIHAANGVLAFVALRRLTARRGAASSRPRCSRCTRCGWSRWPHGV